ncbi:T9SS type A sorting domain-containing protein [Winogradskyella endarachnes]|uniref:T9SS type A sorting domain-containing protein n=1 Tax=Winogradskyella endarachnes TaxID=2681965 RepID=A0A6L6U8D6_9FLAO|nr:T9SS type A sorting domain-containing protein [Winogradskyella endarachnes]MUU78610.1 T9SS type A sorting domain-containing protein [Winogradskyella endarachnes]
MKKFYFLLFCLMSLVSYGQNAAVNGGFENWTAGVPDSYTTVDFSTTDLTENTNATYVSEGASSASVNVLTQSQGDTDIRQTVSLTGGVTYVMSLDVYATNDEARARIFNGSGFNPSVYSDETLLNQWQTISFEYTPTADEVFEFGIRFYDISANWTAGTQSSLFYIDNIQIVEATTPNVVITSPADNDIFDAGTTSVDVVFSTANLVGGESVTITVNGTETANATSPFSIATTDGEAYTVTADLMDGTTSISTSTIDFSVANPSSTVQVADITALRASTIDPAITYELTGEAIVSYVVTDNTRNQRFIQDAGAGVLIDDPSGILTTAFVAGDGITGLKGTLVDYNGLLEFVPTENVAAASSTGNVLPQIIVSASELINNGEAYEGMLITLNNVTFQDTGVFADNTNYSVADGTDVTVCRVTFADEDLIGSAIPTTVSSIMGLGTEYNGTYQIFPRYASDVAAALSVNNFNDTAFSLYPNPTNTGFVSISSTNSDAISVQVFDILGKQVKNETLSNNTLNVSNLKSGVYIVKITQNNASTTKKLVIN